MCNTFEANGKHLCTVIIHQLKSTIMNNLLYTIAILLVIFWALGFFVYNAGNLIHLLLVIAVVAILLRIISGKSIVK